MKILFADTTHPILWEQLNNAGFECVYLELLDRKKALEIISDFDGIVIRSRFKLDEEMLKQARKLKFIARVGAGMENIDVACAHNLGIVCLHAPEGNRNAVAEHALGMLLALFNNLLKADREVREGIWLREENRGVELSGKTVGIIGFGNTGNAFSKILSGFDIQLLAFDNALSNYQNEFVHEVSMLEIFEQADIVSLHVPLTELTQNLVCESWIRQFKKPIYLINTSRGACVKTIDLIAGLESGKIVGAALDVLEFESVSFEQVTKNDESFQYLLKSDKVILSPHIAGWTHESNLKMAQVLFDKIQALKLLE
jgi:D-3-phosphoglycerate dehydrogenase